MLKKCELDSIIIKYKYSSNVAGLKNHRKKINLLFK